MPWLFTPETYDSVDINDASYKSFFRHANKPLQLLTRAPIEIDIPGDYSFPESPRAQASSGQLIMTVRVLTQTQNGLDAARRLFDRFKGFVPLTVSDNNGNTWTIQVRCTQFIERDDTPHDFVATLYTNRPILESAVITDSLRTISASGTAFDPAVAVGGTVRNYPVIEFVATVAKANTNDYINRWQVHMPWRSELPGEDSVGNGYLVDVANGTLDTATETTARMQADGDDLRVFVDGVEFPRVLSGMDTANTKVWVPIHFSPGRTATISATAITSSGNPTNGGSVPVDNADGLLGWPERGYFLKDSELIWYESRTATTLLNVKRGMRNTTAAGHAAGRIDWVEHDIQIVSNYTAATAPTLPLMAINSSSSTNLVHVYSTSMLSPSVQSYGQLKGSFTQDNFKSPVLSMLDLGANGVVIQDVPPGGTGYPYNNIELYVPCGVKVAASAISLVCNGGTSSAAGADVVLDGRVYGVDIDTGVESLLATYAKAARSASATTLTPTAVLQRLRFNAVYTTITGAWFNGAVNVDYALGVDSANETLERFTLTESAVIKAVAFWVRENAAGDTRDLALLLAVPQSPPAPETRDTVATFTAILNAQLGTGYGWVYTSAPSPTFIVVPPAGTYDLVARANGGAGTLYWGKWNAIYPGGEAWQEVTSTWTKQPDADFGFLILGDGSIVQPEAPSGMGGYVKFDEISVTFDDTNLRTPGYVRSAQETIYIHRGTLTHTDVGNSLTLNYIAAIGEMITVDNFSKEVILDENRGIYAPNAITPSDPEQWLYYVGNPTGTPNTLTYTESTPGTVTVQTTRQNAWA